LETKFVSQQKDKPSRREFAKKAAFLSVVAPIAGAGTLAESLPRDPAQEDRPPKLPADFPKLSEQSRAEAEARCETIVKQYSGRFSAEQKEELRRLSYVAQPPLDKLRSYTLQNGDSPALFLKPVVEREKKPAPAAAAAASPAKKP